MNPNEIAELYERPQIEAAQAERNDFHYLRQLQVGFMDNMEHCMFCSCPRKHHEVEIVPPVGITTVGCRQCASDLKTGEVVCWRRKDLELD